MVDFLNRWSGVMSFLALVLPPIALLYRKLSPKLKTLWALTSKKRAIARLAYLHGEINRLNLILINPRELYTELAQSALACAFLVLLEGLCLYLFAFSYTITTNEDVRLVLDQRKHHEHGLALEVLSDDLLAGFFLFPVLCYFGLRLWRQTSLLSAVNVEVAIEDKAQAIRKLSSLDGAHAQ